MAGMGSWNPDLETNMPKTSVINTIVAQNQLTPRIRNPADHRTEKSMDLNCSIIPFSPLVSISLLLVVIH